MCMNEVKGHEIKGQGGHAPFLYIVPLTGGKDPLHVWLLVNRALNNIHIIKMCINQLNKTSNI